MKKIAKFEKVSLKQFEKDWIKTFRNSKDIITEIYNDIKLPSRATYKSAGYDFYAPVHIVLEPKKTIKIPTGIRVYIDYNWVLKLYPRSGLGFKYGMREANTVGIIDADYYDSDNEGHIFVKLINDSAICKTIDIPKGTGFVQGIFSEYGITVDDVSNGIRNGGFGSTDKNE